MNKVILIGNIATDIDLKATPNGNYVANFNLAVNDPKGNATFIPIESWKRVAENVSNYCGKGSKVAIEGSIKIDQWEKDGQKRSFTKVNAFNIQFLESKSNTNSQGSNQNSQKPPQNDSQGNQFEGNGEPLDITDDDLPF